MNISYEYNLQRLPSIATRDKIKMTKRYLFGLVTYQHRLAQKLPMEEKLVQDKHGDIPR